ncbi:MAG TPA: glycerol-3-phosphate 1-O-acyltransferase PlsY [Candidatus Latescibacteria bacterium]|nr:glycerol-3-phosphate 1-O-acyltransferase PlsY [Candidatus Latescibacterota bacterium]
MSLILAFLLSYLLGSLVPGLWVPRLKGIDIREHGSGNPGATNVYRVLGWKYALPVGITDFGKGLAAVALASHLAGPLAWGPILCGLAAVVGHMWPIFGGFRGGRGVLTAAGALTGLAPLGVLVAVVVWSVVAFSTKYVSLGSISAAVAFPLSLVVQRELGVPVSDGLLGLSALVCALIILRHRPNIQRLLRGEEHRFRRKK